MADHEEKGSSAWYKVPVWDGNPAGFRSFKREMEWWQASMDASSCSKFNVAARWTLRQTGVVRARCEEFSPSELEGTPEVVAKDPVSGEDIVVEPADPWRGIRILMTALEESMGRTTLDRKGELRKQFYVDLRRNAGERISAYCSRFRTLVSEMRREGITLHSDELGWFLRSRMGLDAIRSQLLDTALRGKESYEEVEAESLRLFRDLHSEDPLQKRGMMEKAPLLSRFLNQSQSGSSYRTSLPSSAGSSFGGKSLKSSFSGGSQRSFRPMPKPSPPPRSALVAEGPADGEEDEEELVPVEEENEMSLEQVLQCEAEVLAAEIEELEQEGLAPDLIEGLETGVEQAAESLVTMREARSKIAEIKKDRGYGKVNPSAAPPGKPKFTGNQVNGKKSKSSCWDCGQTGHWAGDHGCPSPGAGLFKPKGGNKPQKQVRVAEALTTEFDAGGEPEVETVHEVMTTSRLFHPSTLSEALSSSFEVYANQGQSLSLDKKLVGALDSACNRTCCGTVWLEHYLRALQSAPQVIKELVEHQPEQETFRFGDGGTQKSSVRVRLPMMVGSDLILTWVSVVPVPSLGLLLGRDWLDSVGAVLSFAKKILRADHLSGLHIRLRQLVAGHFALPLVPSSWPLPGAVRWRRVGLDGVVALQISHQEWMKRKLEAVQMNGVFGSSGHEHLLSEHSLHVADVSLLGLPVENAASMDDLAQKMSTFQVVVRNPSTSSPTTPGRSRAPGIGDGKSKPMAKVVKNGSAAPCKSYVARARNCIVALSAALAALSSAAVPFHQQRAPVAVASSTNGGQWGFVTPTPHYGNEGRSLHRVQPQGMHVAEGQTWLGDSLRGRSNVGWHAGSSKQQRLGESDPPRSPKGSSIGIREGRERRETSRSSERTHRTPRRLAVFEARSFEVGRTAPDQAAREGDHRSAKRAHPACPEGCHRQDSSDKDGVSRWRKFKSGACAEFERSFQTDRSETFNQCPTRSSSKSPSEREHAGHSRADGHAGREISVNAVSSDATGHEHADATGSANSSRPHHGRSSTSRGHGSSGGRRRQPDGSWHGDQRHGSECLAGAEKRHASRSFLQSMNDRVEEFNNPWSLHQELKPGQAQLIGQAWEKHCRDRSLVSKSKNEVLEAMHSEWDRELRDCFRENFIMKLEIAPPKWKKEPDKVQPLVGEVYTATEQVSKQASLRGHRTATSMSLETGWNFLDPAHRKACVKKVVEEDPFCLILAFPCGPWSPLTRLRPSASLAERQEEGRVLLNFAILLARIQLKRGGHFVMENPKGSAAWGLPEMAQFLESAHVECVDFDQCAFLLRSAEGFLHKKPTRVATSSAAVADELRNMQCTRDHFHLPVIGGSKITSRAGHYPVALAKAFVKGLEKQFHADHGHCREVLAVDGEEVEQEENVAEGLVPFDSESEISSMDEESAPGTKISSATRLAVKRLHENTGHRSKRRLARALVLSGAPAEVVRAAKELRCSLCDEKSRPKSRRPSSLPSPKDVSDQVHLDVFESTDINEQKFYIVHAIDWVSRFQMGEVLATKDSESICSWFKQRWLPIFGPPRVIVADQGKEFCSWVFQEMCDQHSILLHHIPIQAPWCNGVCERGGGILKGLLECCVKSKSVLGLEDMSCALQECVLAYNSDINEMDVSPCQAAVGRQPRMIGDVLGSFSQRLAEHGLVDSRPSLARQIALRETARVAMTRLHFSKGIRRAELSRSRTSTMSQPLEPGSIVYFWRESKYNSKTSPSKKRLSLRRWHGPALLVALEGHNAGYVSFKGQLSKCAREHLRLASSMEQISAEVWHDAIQDCVEAALHDGRRPGVEETSPLTPSPPRALTSPMAPTTPSRPSSTRDLATVPEEQEELPPVGPSEFIQALDGNARFEESELPGSGSLSRRASLMSSQRSASRTSAQAAPGTPVPELIRNASQLAAPSTPPLSSRFEETVERARELDEEAASRKRTAEIDAEALRDRERASEAEAHSTLVATAVIQNVLQTKNDLMHKYVKVQKNVEVPQNDLVFEKEDTFEETFLKSNEHPLKLILEQVKKDKLDPSSVR